MEYNRARLKRGVKLSMKNTVPKPMLVALVFSIAVSAGTWLINTILGGLLTGGVDSISDTLLYYIQNGSELEEALYITMLGLFRQGPGAMFGAIVGGGVLSIVVTLWQSTMNVGYKGWCLSMVRNENPPMGKIFGALPQFGQVLVTRVLTELFAFLWSLLVVVAYIVLVVVLVIVDAPVFTLLMLIVGTVAAVLGVIWVTMRYALVDYALLDKGLSGMDAIRESKRLMQGRIQDAYILELSFFGWYLLEAAIIYGGVALALVPVIAAADSLDGLVAASGMALLVIIAAVIGFTVLTLWLRPYTTGAMAKFYDFTQGRTGGFTQGAGFGGGSEGWGGPADYTWNSGSSSGTGIGTGPRNDGPSPKPPKSPRDDPWN